MKKLLLFASFLAIPFFGNAQAFQENFDGSGPGFAAWTVIDNDGLTANAAVADIVGWVRKDRGGPTPNYGGPDNDFAAVSTSWYSPAGTSDDWLITPQIAVPTGVTSFKWDAKAQDADFPDGYKLMLSPNGGNTIADFTVELYNTAGEDAAWVTREVNTSAYAGTNVRFAFVNNSNDMFVLLIDNISLGAYVPPTAYCGPLAFTLSVEPITLVNFAGINNTTDATVGGTPDHEDFTSIVGNVVQGSSYNITLKGNTDGATYTNRFAVFIDWNQDFDFADAGETYEITQTITGSTGTDAIQAVQSLAVPADAMVGNTRMRVKKIYGTTSYLDPCTGASFGQAEDYTISVATLAVSDVAKNSLKVYPNPVVDMMNVESAAKVKSVSVYDATGKLVSSNVMNAVKSQVNLSKLTAGAYVVTIETENGTQSVKIIKK